MRWTLAQTSNTILVSSIVSTSVAGTSISIESDAVDLERRDPARQRARPPPLKLAPRRVAASQTPKALSPVRRLPSARSPAVRRPIARSPARPPFPKVVVRARAQTNQRKPSLPAQRTQRSPIRSPPARARFTLKAIHPSSQQPRTQVQRGRSIVRSPTVRSPLRRGKSPLRSPAVRTTSQRQRATSLVRSPAAKRARSFVRTPASARVQQRGRTPVRSPSVSRARARSQSRSPRVATSLNRSARPARVTTQRRVTPRRTRTPVRASTARRRVASPIARRVRTSVPAARRRRVTSPLPRRARRPSLASSARRSTTSKFHRPLRPSPRPTISRTTLRASPKARLTQVRTPINNNAARRPGAGRATAQRRSRSAVANARIPRVRALSRSAATVGLLAFALPPVVHSPSERLAQLPLQSRHRRAWICRRVERWSSLCRRRRVTKLLPCAPAARGKRNAPLPRRMPLGSLRQHPPGQCGHMPPLTPFLPNLLAQSRLVSSRNLRTITIGTRDMLSSAMRCGILHLGK